MRKLWRTFKVSYRQLLHYGVLALLVFVPLYPKFPLVAVSGSRVAVRLEDILVAVVVGMYVAGVARDWRRVVEDRLNQAVFLFWLSGLVSLVSGVWVTQTVSGAVGAFHLLRRMEYMGLFLVAREAIYEKRQLAVYVWTLVAVVFGVTLYGLGQMWWGWPVISTQNLEFSKGLALRWVPGARLTSTFAGHYDLSAFAAMLLPIWAVFLAVLRGKKEKLVMAAVGGASLWLLLASASRISFPAAVVAVGVSLVLLRQWKWMIVVFGVALVGLLGSGDLAARYEQVAKYETGKVIEKIEKKLKVMVPVALAAGAEPTPAGLVRRVSERLSPTPTPVPVAEDRSSSIRLNVEWPRALRAFGKNPLLGTGFSSITLATDNDYLRLAGEVGVVGLAAFGLIFLRLTGRLKRVVLSARKKVSLGSWFVVGAVGSVVGMLINATFIDVFEASKVAMVFWLVLGWAVRVVEMEEK